jgi:hypothetical protein
MRSDRARDDCFALAAIASIFAVSWFLVGAAANAPVIDDWVYAWSVEDFLKTARLHVLPFSAIYPLAQILWGALFARVAGFSFGVLRLSTVIASIAGCFAVYLTLREMECRLSTALLGAFAVALHPVYFALSFSFMTEVPFIALACWTIYFSVRAVRRDARWSFWAAAVCSLAAFLVRPVAIALPAALLPALWWTRNWRRGLLPIASVVAAMIVLQILLPRIAGPLDGTAMRVGFLAQWASVGVASYARWTVEVLIIAVFPLTPLWLAQFTTWRSAIAAVIATIALVAACRWAVGYIVNPLPNWQTWSLQDIGGSRALIGGSLQKSAWSVRIAPLVTAIGFLGAGASLAAAARALQRRNSWRGDGVVIAAFIVVYLALVHLLWFYNDRYYVVFAPALAIAGAKAIDTNRTGKCVAATVFAIWAAISITGTREMISFNDTLTETARELETSGVPAWQVDAGYASNGWRLYAHPENGRPGSDRRYSVPFVTSADIVPYSISSSPLPDSEVIRVIPLPNATWQASRELYLLRRHPKR